MHCQAPLHMVGELCDKGVQKLFHLLLGWMQRIFNAGKQRIKDKQDRLLERLVLHFVCHCVKQSPKGTDIFVLPPRQRQHQVTREHKCHMCSQCIVRETGALLPEAQERCRDLKCYSIFSPASVKRWKKGQRSKKRLPIRSDIAKKTTS